MPTACAEMPVGEAVVLLHQPEHAAVDLVEGLLLESGLGTGDGLALMCLAEALLRNGIVTIADRPAG